MKHATTTTQPTLEQIAEQMAIELAARRERAWPMAAALAEFRRRMEEAKRKRKPVRD